MPESSSDELMSVPQVAQALRYTEATIRNWIRNSKLPAVQANKREYRIRRSDFRALAEGLTGAAEVGSTGQATLETAPLISQVRRPDER